MKPTREMIEQEIERQRAGVGDGLIRSKRSPLLYALKLEKGRFYIGRTEDSIERVKQHIQGKGAHWTRLHAPIGLIECRPCRGSNNQEADQSETLWTLEYMRRYGWRNVRGGYFCQVDELQTEKALRAHGVFDAIQQPNLRIHHNR